MLFMEESLIVLINLTRLSLFEEDEKLASKLPHPPSVEFSNHGSITSILFLEGFSYGLKLTQQCLKESYSSARVNIDCTGIYTP